jgi:hypothetical protein
MKMSDRKTQVLLGAVVLLLVALNFRDVFWPSGVQAQEAAAGKVTDVVRTRMLELVDTSGQVRANLKVEPGGEVVFRLRDAKGTIRVKLGAGDDGSGLLLLDDQTEPGVQMLVKKTGTTVTLAEKGKQKRVITPSP